MHDKTSNEAPRIYDNEPYSDEQGIRGNFGKTLASILSPSRQLLTSVPPITWFQNGSQWLITFKKDGYAEKLLLALENFSTIELSSLMLTEKEDQSILGISHSDFICLMVKICKYDYSWILNLLMVLSVADRKLLIPELNSSFLKDNDINELFTNYFQQVAKKRGSLGFFWKSQIVLDRDKVQYTIKFNSANPADYDHATALIKSIAEGKIKSLTVSDVKNHEITVGFASTLGLLNFLMELLRSAVEYNRLPKNISESKVSNVQGEVLQYFSKNASPAEVSIASRVCKSWRKFLVDDNSARKEKILEKVVLNKFRAFTNLHCEIAKQNGAKRNSLAVIVDADNADYAQRVFRDVLITKINYCPPVSPSRREWENLEISKKIKDCYASKKFPVFMSLEEAERVLAFDEDNQQHAANTPRSGF